MTHVLVIIVVTTRIASFSYARFGTNQLIQGRSSQGRFSPPSFETGTHFIRLLNMYTWYKSEVMFSYFSSAFDNEGCFIIYRVNSTIRFVLFTS